MDNEKLIKSLQQENERLKNQCSALKKSNRNWRRKAQRLRGKEPQPAVVPVAPKKEAPVTRAKEEPMNYFISDLHFFCNSQVDNGIGENYDSRPFKSLDEMHTYMLQRWNEKVTNGDTVYILGDVALRGRNDALIALVSQLKGKKVLIKGNHDDLSDYRYKQLFHEILDYKELSENFDGQAYKLVLSHYPILMWNGQHKGTILLYGHTHSSVEDSFFQDCIERMNESEELSLRRHGGKKIRAINVGCMQPYMNYEPRTIREILEAQNNT